MKEIFVCILLFLISIIPVYSQDNTLKEGEQKMILNLDQCVKKAVEISREIGESRYDVEVYKSKRKQAEAAAYPSINPRNDRPFARGKKG